MKKTLLAVALAATTVLALPGTALAQSQQFRLISAGPANAPGTIIATGPFSGVGRVITINDTTDRVVFPGKGTFILTHESQGGSVTFDPTTCTATFSETGTWTISGGTGMFAGATGSGAYTLNNGKFIGTRIGGGRCSEAGGRLSVVVQLTGDLNLLR